ncbi:hypothetical protein niasHT_025766 [Heterodera trifolii]|uniref:LIM/homeobox protein Lhx9 n=1 Tax=Heterodera trifolii TaxID=157864 RepID=A0ABD2KRR1_9BILA
MLFFPPPTSAAAADLLVDPAIDGLLLNGVIMPKPSELEQTQRNQQAEQLQRQLAIMGQQLQQQMPMRGSELSPTQPNVPSLIGPFSGLLTTAQIDEIEPIGSDKGTDMQMLTSANCLMPPIVGLSPIPSVSLGNTFTQLTPPIGLQQRQQPIDHIQPNLLLHSAGKIIYFSFLLVDDQKWHSECCVCVICGQNLEKDGPTCFVRDGFLFCHRDYFAKYGKPCDRCGIPIARGELVMKVPQNGNSDQKSLLFHVHCFSCVCCGQMLSPGQQFTVGISGQPGGALFCNAHFHLNPSLSLGQFSHKMSDEEQLHFLTDLCSSNLGGHGQQTNRKVFEQLSTGVISPNNSQTDSRYSFAESSKENPDSLRLSSPSVTPNGTDAFCAGRNGGGSSNGGETPGAMGANGRQKRMRTSFKHHQLRTMKNYFACNHNPDAKDLKQLSQKTGLTKRVLQVWFQNARAKHRRNQQIRGEVAAAMDGTNPSLTTTISGVHVHASLSTSVEGDGGAIHGGGYRQNHSLPPPLSVTDHPPPVPMFVAGSKVNSAVQSPSASVGPRSLGTSSASSFSSAEERGGGSFENEAN